MPLPRKRLIPGILLALMLAAIAAPPAWWSAGNPPVITGAAANNRGPANIGQAKHMAKSALDALRPILPAVVTQIENDLASIVDLTVPDPKTPEWIEKQKDPLLIGQLKAIADPFYTRLNAASPTWLAAERTANGTNHPNSIFPWTAETTDDQNKSIATIGQLKAVFSLRFETLPQGPADTDNDGLPYFWEMQYFGNLNQTANGDPDEDDINNAQENQLGLDPTHLDKIGPVNLGFDEEITDFPDMSFRDEYPSDLYDQSSIPGYYTDGNENTEGWQADTGSHIEIWNEGVSSSSVPPPPAPSSPYVELQSHLGGHGVKQVFNMLPGTRLNFILRYKGRYEYDAYHNAFDLKVEGASELLVDGSPASATGTTRSKVFMDDDDWNKYTDWHNVSISITAEAGDSGLKRVTLSLVPKTTTRPGEEEITYGGFVDLLPVKVKDIKDSAITSDDVTISPWDTTAQTNPTDTNIAWIEPHKSVTDAAPRMPQLELKISGLPATMTIQAKIEVQYTRGNGARAARNQAEDRVRIPADGSFQTVTGDTWKIWEAYAAETFFGGEATLTYKLMTETTETLAPQIIRFRIGGKNPDAARARTHIETLNDCGPTGSLWFAYAIARSESRDYNDSGSRYNQFLRLPQNPRDNGFPLWGNDGGTRPGGYGMFQVTGNVQDSEVNIPRDQIWNWQSNAAAARVIIVDKRRASTNWMTTQSNATHANGAAVPSHTVGNVTFDGTTYTMLHACTIKAYNGASKPSTDTDNATLAGFVVDPSYPSIGHYGYWHSGQDKWGLCRFNNLGFNYVLRVCGEVQP